MRARGRAQQLSYASSGVGSASHVIAEAFVKRQSLRALAVTTRERVPVLIRPNVHSRGYLEAKRTRMNHSLPRWTEGFDAEFDVFEQMASAAPERPFSMSLLQRDLDPTQWKRILARVAEKFDTLNDSMHRLYERKGAEVGMITTRGFRDILHMARHKRPHNFSLQFDVPWQSKPLVKRRNRIVVDERVMPPAGEIETPLNEDQVRAAAHLFKQRGLHSVIICFLFSFLNNSHELRAKEIVKDVMPGAYVCCSSEVVNVIREYERFSTAAMNAYIGLKTALYLSLIHI